jgi:hypothetical protein
MRKESGQKDAERSPARDDKGGKRKQPYRTPRLTTYGDLRGLALQKGGSKNDGCGAPKSRA